MSTKQHNSLDRGPPRPNSPPKNGRLQPWTQEEVVEFMEKAINSEWAQKYADHMAHYLSEYTGKYETVDREYIKVVACAGVIAKPVTADQTAQDIIRMWHQAN